MSNAPRGGEGFPFWSPSPASFGGSVFCIAYLPPTETKPLVDLLEFHAASGTAGREEMDLSVSHFNAKQQQQKEGRNELHGLQPPRQTPGL